MNYEAFVYLWYHGPTKRYYLGKHKGTIDDGYSHSSSVMESWDANNPPDGWRRRILFYGTHDNCIDKEMSLLYKIKKKKHFNKRYINLTMADPIKTRMWAKSKRKQRSMEYVKSIIGDATPEQWQEQVPDWN